MNLFVSWIPSRIGHIKSRLSGTDITSRLVRGTFWASIGALVSRSFAMVSSIIVVRLLGKEGYGEMGMVYSTMGMLGVFAGFGLGSAATKYIAESRLTDPLRTGRTIKLITGVSLATAGTIAVVSVILSPWLAVHSLNRIDIVPLLRAGALLLFFSELAGVQQGVLAGFEAFKKSAKINFYQGIISPVITVPCVWLYGVQGAIAALTINMALTLILCQIALRSELKKNLVILAEPFHLCWMEHPILTRFALPAMFSLSLTIPVIWLTNTMLVNRAGGYGELGLFNAANQWRQVIIFIPALLSSAMLPILSQAHGQEDKSDFKRVVALNLRMIWVIALPVTILMMILGKPLAALFGRQFSGAAPLISVLMVSCFLNVVNGTVGNALSGSGKMWIGTAMNLAWAAVLLFASWLLIPLFGGLGLALAYLLAYLFHSVWQMAYVELKLAPMAISKQWRLILFSLILLFVGMWIGIYGQQTILRNVMLVVISAIPLLNFLRMKYSSMTDVLSHGD